MVVRHTSHSNCSFFGSYRGYRLNDKLKSSGAPYEAGLKQDTQAALDFLLSRPDVNPKQVSLCLAQSPILPSGVSEAPAFCSSSYILLAAMEFDLLEIAVLPRALAKCLIMYLWYVTAEEKLCKSAGCPLL